MLIDSTSPPLLRLITWTEMCANPNHCKVMKQNLVGWFLESLQKNQKF